MLGPISNLEREVMHIVLKIQTDCAYFYERQSSANKDKVE